MYPQPRCSLGPCKASHWVTLMPPPPHTHPHRTSNTHVFIRASTPSLTQRASSPHNSCTHLPCIMGAICSSCLADASVRFICLLLPFILCSSLPPAFSPFPFILSLIVPITGQRLLPLFPTPAPRSCTNSSWVLLGDPSLSAS